MRIVNYLHQGLDWWDCLEIKISINSEVSYTKVIFILIYKTQLVLIELSKIRACPARRQIFLQNLSFFLIVQVSQSLFYLLRVILD